MNLLSTDETSSQEYLYSPAEKENIDVDTYRARQRAAFLHLFNLPYDFQCFYI